MSDVRENSRIGWTEVFPGHLHHLWPLLDCEDFTPGEEGPTRALLESWRGPNSLVSYSWTFTEPLLRASCVCNSRRLRELRTTIYHNWTLSTLSLRKVEMYMIAPTRPMDCLHTFYQESGARSLEYTRLLCLHNDNKYLESFIIIIITFIIIIIP